MAVQHRQHALQPVPLRARGRRPHQQLRSRRGRRGAVDLRRRRRLPSWCGAIAFLARARRGSARGLCRRGRPGSERADLRFLPHAGGPLPAAGLRPRIFGERDGRAPRPDSQRQRSGSRTELPTDRRFAGDLARALRDVAAGQSWPLPARRPLLRSLRSQVRRAHHVHPARPRAQHAAGDLQPVGRVDRGQIGAARHGVHARLPPARGRHRQWDRRVLRAQAAGHRGARGPGQVRRGARREAPRRGRAWARCTSSG